MLPHPLRFIRRRPAEMPFEVAAELGGAGVADVGGDFGDGAGLAGDHQPCLVQAQGLHILHRAAAGQCLEVDVEGRDAHAGVARQIGDGDFRAVVAAQPGEAADNVSRRAFLPQGGDHRATLRADEHAIVELAEQSGAEDRAVDRAQERGEKAQQRVLDRGVHPARHQALGLVLGEWAVRLHREGDFGGELQVELHVDGEQRPLRAGGRLHAEGNGYRHREIVVLVVAIGLAFEKAEFAALQDEYGARPVEHRHVVQHGLRPEDADTIDAGGVVALARRQFGGQGDEGLPALAGR